MMKSRKGPDEGQPEAPDNASQIVERLIEEERLRISLQAACFGVAAGSETPIPDGADAQDET